MFLIFPFIKVYGLHAALCYCPPGKLESLHILSTQKKKETLRGFWTPLTNLGKAAKNTQYANEMSSCAAFN